MPLLSKCFSIETYSSLWRTSLYHYAMLTAASCSTSSLRVVIYGLELYIYTYIYTYIYSSGCVQGYILQYMCICRVYMHIWSLANIYISHRYMFAMLICLFSCILYAVYVRMSVNECKMHAPLHIIVIELIFKVIPLSHDSFFVLPVKRAQN